MALIVDTISQEMQALGPNADDLIDWRERYEGVLLVAYLDGKAVAGISGPWPVNQFALTWWDRPVPSRQLELFDSLHAARQRVEEWAHRLRTMGVSTDKPANDPVLADAVVPSRAPSWLERIRDAIAGSGATPTIASRDTLRGRPLNDDDLRGVHFAAIE